MSSNTLKSEDKSGAAIFGSKRNTGTFWYLRLSRVMLEDF
jgi:hypothetical protein